jgi:hypothetical protein
MAFDYSSPAELFIPKRKGVGARHWTVRSDKLPAAVGISSAAAGQREAAIGQPVRTADIEYLDRVAHHLAAGLDVATARRRAATELAEERYARDGDVWRAGPTHR